LSKFSGLSAKVLLTLTLLSATAGGAHVRGLEHGGKAQSTFSSGGSVLSGGLGGFGGLGGSA
jgi:hypothetical protein